MTLNERLTNYLNASKYFKHLSKEGEGLGSLKIKSTFNCINHINVRRFQVFLALRKYDFKEKFRIQENLKYSSVREVKNIRGGVIFHATERQTRCFKI